MYLQTSAISNPKDRQSQSEHSTVKGQLRHSWTPNRDITQGLHERPTCKSRQVYNARDISIVSKECHHVGTAEATVIKCPSDGIINWINSVNGSSWPKKG